jgi:hypothetical protein
MEVNKYMNIIKKLFFIYIIMLIVNMGSTIMEGFSGQPYLSAILWIINGPLMILFDIFGIKWPITNNFYVHIFYESIIILLYFYLFKNIYRNIPGQKRSG